MYYNLETFIIVTRYKDKNDNLKTVTVIKGFGSDGATGGIDVCDKSFFGHDWVCGNYIGKGPKPIGGLFDDGSKITNWQASTIHCDELRKCADSTIIWYVYLALAYYFCLWWW